MAISSKNLYDDNDDIKFHLDKMVDWHSLVPLREEGFKDFKIYQETQNELFSFAPANTEEAVEGYKTLLSSFGEICAEVIMENARAIDQEEMRLENGKVIFPAPFEKNIQVLTENGYMGIFLPRKYGGWQMPNIGNCVGAELITTADCGMATLLGTQDLGDIIYKFASDEIKDKYLPKIASGEMGAAMLLTEPNFGSDLQNAQTKGEMQPDGTLLVNGVKMWITHGAPHTPDGQVYLTVTRTVKKEDGSFRSGAAGLSLVLIESKDAEIVSLEKKMGIHSSPTVQLSFDNSRGVLVGEEGRGLVEYTLALMNSARLGVASQGIGISERSYREAFAYANIREQFGTLIKNIPAVAKMLDEIRISTEASRALVYYTGYCVDMQEGLERKFHNEGMAPREIRKHPEVVKWSKLAKVLTPFAKFYACEESNRNAYKAQQIHGGVGFSEEYDISRIYRDARILTIYEGTSQLQVVAAIGGVTEGYSTDKSTLLAHQSEMRANTAVSSALQPYLTKLIEAESMLKKIIPFFKEQETEFKGRYADIIVWSAIMIFTSHLWLQMANRDESGAKTEKAKVFLLETFSYVSKSVLDIELFARMK